MKTFDFPVLFKEAGSRWGNEDNLWMRENGMLENLYDPDNTVGGATAIFKVADQAWIVSRGERLFTRNVARTRSANVRLLSIAGDGIFEPGLSEREILEFCISQIALMPTIDPLTLGRDLIANVPDRHFMLPIGKIQNSSWSGAHGANTPPKIAERLEREERDYVISASDPVKDQIKLYSIPRGAGKTTVAKQLMATEAREKGDFDGDAITYHEPTFKYRELENLTLVQYIDILRKIPLGLPDNLVTEIKSLIGNLVLHTRRKEITEGTTRFAPVNPSPERNELTKFVFSDPIDLLKGAVNGRDIYQRWAKFLAEGAASDNERSWVVVTNPGQVGGPPWNKEAHFNHLIASLGLDKDLLQPRNTQPTGRGLTDPLEKLTMKKEYTFSGPLRTGKSNIEGMLKVSDYRGNEHGLATFIDEPLDHEGKTDDPLKAIIMAEAARNEAEQYLKDREDK